MKVVCAECMKMCCLGGNNLVVKRLSIQLHGHMVKFAKKRYEYMVHVRSRKYTKSSRFQIPAYW